MIAPTVEQLASEMAGRVRVAKMNVDENPVTASRSNVRTIPTLLIITKRAGGGSYRRRAIELGDRAAAGTVRRVLLTCVAGPSNPGELCR